MAVEKQSSISQLLRRGLRRSIVPSLAAAYCLFLVVFGIVNPIFLSLSNIKNIIVNLGITGIVAIGVSVVMLTGNVDISVGSNFLVVSVLVMGLFNLGNLQLSPSLVIASAVIAGGLIGALNGLIVTRVGINSVITTLGTMFLFKGIGQTLGTAYSYNAPSITNAAFLRFGRGYLLESIALPFVYFLLILLILHFFLRLTKMGHDIYTTGASTSLARIFGVNVRRAQFLTFVLSGCLAGFAAALSVAQLARTDPYFGQGLEFQALTITVLGGISLAGGRGSLLGVLLAVLIVGSISNGLAVVKVPVNMRDAINGIILIAALLIDSVRQRSIGFRS